MNKWRLSAKNMQLICQKNVNIHGINCWNSLKFNLRNSAMLPRFKKQYNNSFVVIDEKFISLHGSVYPEVFIILFVK